MVRFSIVIFIFTKPPLVPSTSSAYPSGDFRGVAPLAAGNAHRSWKGDTPPAVVVAVGEVVLDRNGSRRAGRDQTPETHSDEGGSHRGRREGNQRTDAAHQANPQAVPNAPFPGASRRGSGSKADRVAG